MSGHWSLTTSDNPYNPNGGEDEFRQWLQFDTQMKYYTLSYVARVARTSSELSEADQQLAFDHAVAGIIEHDVTGMYVLIDEHGNRV